MASKGSNARAQLPPPTAGRELFLVFDVVYLFKKPGRCSPVSSTAATSQTRYVPSPKGRRGRQENSSPANRGRREASHPRSEAGPCTPISLRPAEGQEHVLENAGELKTTYVVVESSVLSLRNWDTIPNSLNSLLWMHCS